MKLFTFLLFAIGFGLVSFGQLQKVSYEQEEMDHSTHDHDDPVKGTAAYYNPDNFPHLLDGFDEKAVRIEFNQIIGIEGEWHGYLRGKKWEYLHKNHPNKFGSKDKGDDVIPGKSAACPNVGFEDLTFAPQWQGGIGLTQSAPGGGTGFNNTTIQNNGFNPGITDVNARQSIMTTSPINNNPANGAIIGYDPFAYDPATNIHAIPVVAPGGGGASVRLGGEITQYRKQRVIYEYNVTNQNRAFYYQFAIVMEEPSNVHPANRQPYFRVSLTDVNDNPLGGSCGTYQVDASLVGVDTSFRKGPPEGTGFFYYRPWDRVNLDLSQYIGQTIKITMESASCDQSGHSGWAYVDAGCLSNIDASASYCPGDPYALIVAQEGFASYKWYGPNDFNNLIVGATDDTLQIASPTVGDSFLVELGTQNGCAINQVIYLEYSYVNIDEFFKTNTCFGAAVGSANVIASGSISGYNYTWTPLGVTTTDPSLDSIPAGTYTLTVSSPNSSCGTDDTTFIIDFAPVFPTTINSSFCEGVGKVEGPSSTSYQWYDNDGNAIPAPIGNDSIIYDNNAFQDKKYFLKYGLPNGCFDTAIYVFQDRKNDSTRFQLTQPVDCRSLKIVFDDWTPVTDTITFSFIGQGVYDSLQNSVDSTWTYLGLNTGNYDIRVVDEGCYYDTNYTITDIASDSVYYFEFCPEDQYYFSTTSNGDHYWTDPNGTFLDSTKNITISNIIPGWYIDSCEVALGCYSLWRYNLDSITIQTDFNTQDVICAGGNDGAIFMEYIFGPAGDPTYKMYGPNGFYSEEDSVFGLSAGLYIVYSQLYSCNQEDSVYIYEPNIDGDTLSIAASLCGDIIQTTLFAPSGYNGYQWYFQGQPIGNETDDSLRITLPANFDDYYVLYYMPPNPCKVKTKDIEAGSYSFGFEAGVMNNVFSPNSDDVNSIYYPFHDKNWSVDEIAAVADEYRMIIYNRWGNKVFETTDYLVGWDGTKNGTPLADGAYFANVLFMPKCGVEEDLFKTTIGFQVVR
jgi:gliding motility-associated-like protein